MNANREVIAHDVLANPADEPYVQTPLGEGHLPHNIDTR